MTHAYTAPPYVWLIALVIAAYLGTVIYLWGYLKRVHHDVWLKLGSPSFLNNSILNGFRSLAFIFGGRYRSLSDPRLTGLIWSVRGLFALVGALFVFGKIFGLVPPR